MIQIKILDRNGKELSNGDKIRYLDIHAEMQEDRGDNIPGGYYCEQVGTNIKWVEEIYDAQQQIDDDGWICPPILQPYSRGVLCDAFGVDGMCNDEEFNECVLDYVNEEIGEKYTLNELIDALNGFEIIEEAKPDCIDICKCKIPIRELKESGVFICMRCKKIII